MTKKLRPKKVDIEKEISEFIGVRDRHYKEIDKVQVVRDIVSLAGHQKVSRIKIGDIEIEMHPDAFKTPAIERKPLTAMQNKLSAQKKAREEEDLQYWST